MKKVILYVLGLFMILNLIGCKRIEGYKYIDGKVNIVATTTMLGDLAKEVGGEHVSVTTLMAVGVDPHSYVPRPSATNSVSKADLVIINGLFLEAQMGKVISTINDEKLLVIGDYFEESQLLKDEDGALDPHVWFDVENWKVATNALYNKLVSIDGDNKTYYENRVKTYLDELTKLDNYVIDKVKELPEEKRILVTAHDAFSYFGKAYGFEVYAIQGISTETEASAKDIQDLANLVVDLKVKAIFVESSVPENTINSVINAAKAKEHDVVVGGELFSDSLGDEISGADTYLKMVKKNVDTIVNNLK
ncbi:MAG TPA: zinc ABC transporter solute-binding protein [Acholeplasmataceae bacterium]|nr:zinc ABC transporter solute-binding protein [Acholeplasmataceae bacterium]